MVIVDRDRKHGLTCANAFPRPLGVVDDRRPRPGFLRTICGLLGHRNVSGMRVKASMRMGRTAAKSPAAKSDALTNAERLEQGDHHGAQMQ
jgi:hypothetical protein